MQLLILESSLLNRLCRSQLMSSVDKSNGACKLCQIHSLFHRRVSAAYYKYGKILEEVGITGCTVGNTLSKEFLLSLTSDRTGICSRSNNQGLTFIRSIHTDKSLYIPLQLYRLDCIVYTITTKMLSLLCHSLNQRRSGLSFYNLSRIVLNRIRDCNLSSILPLFDNTSGEPCPTCIKACCKSPRTGT